MSVSTRKGPVIVGVGAALMDLLLEEDEGFLSRMGSEKGGMTLVEQSTILNALAATPAPVSIVAGGSACNSMVGIGLLGGRSRMVGKLGRDELGDKFLHGLEKAGVETHITRSDTGTGRVLSVVTPDAQRTMFTYLGASAELSPEDLHAAQFADADMVLLEGYLLFNRPVVEKILELTAGTPAKLVLDLGSFQVVEACRELLEHLISEHVDILLANEDEARAFTGMGEDGSLELFAAKVGLAVVKLGKDGVLLAQGSERLKVPARVVEAIDTTGAGDLWAAGFLHGLAQGYGLEHSARLGCVLGSEVVQIMGALIPEQGWDRIHRFMGELP